MNKETDTSIQFDNKIKNLNELKKYVDKLKELDKLLNNFGSKFDNSKINKKLNETLEIVDKIHDKTAILGETVEKSFSVGSVKNFFSHMVNLWKQITKVTEKSANYLENMNLLDVAYNNNTTSAEKLVNKMTEMYGLDESWGYRTVGIFKQLSNAMGLADETGTKLANTLSILAVDLSSLYNDKTSSAVQKLTSALAGQTKPIRSYGADITQMTLQQTLLNNGIDLTVDKLSFAEKRLLITIAILEQTQEAQGDWARTINCSFA